MILSSRTVEWVSDRIERAYCRRYQEATCFMWDTRVWLLAARALLEEHQKNPWLPVDPELFVAAQCRLRSAADHWRDLSPPQAIRRYEHRVRQIIKKLRCELLAEVRRAEKAVSRGETIDAVVLRRNKSLSPLGRLIVAWRANRYDLADSLRLAARHQHDACPLYRVACVELLPPEHYPVFELVEGISLTPLSRPQRFAVALN